MVLNLKTHTRYLGGCQYINNGKNIYDSSVIQCVSQVLQLSSTLHIVSVIKMNIIMKFYD